MQGTTDLHDLITASSFEQAQGLFHDPAALDTAIVEAFWHAGYMLEMLVRYGHELDAPPDVLPGGWAAVLELFQQR